MPHFATLQDGAVVGVQSAAFASDVPTGSVELPNWAGWPVRPSPAHTPVIVNGAVQWQDLRTVEQAWAEVRSARDALLRSSDWRPVYAADRGGLEQVSWANSQWRAYRQTLRDITEQSDPRNITWPTPPA